MCFPHDAAAHFIRMKGFISNYWLYIKTFLHARAEYRVSFILGMVSNFYCYFITYCTYWVITSGLGTIAGWTFPDLSILYGLSLLTYALSGTMFWYTVLHLEESITRGDLDIYLTRPLGVLDQLIFQRFGDTFIGQIVVSSLFLGLAFFSNNDSLNLIRILYLILSIIDGVMLQSGGMIIIGSLSFWMNRSSSLGNILYYDLRDMTKYPLSIFPNWIQYLLTFIFPWAFINYYPALILTQKIQSTYELVLAVLSPIVGFSFFKFALFLFHQGLKKYNGAGS